MYMRLSLVAALALVQRLRSLLLTFDLGPDHRTSGKQNADGKVFEPSSSERFKKSRQRLFSGLFHYKSVVPCVICLRPRATAYGRARRAGECEGVAKLLHLLGVLLVYLLVTGHRDGVKISFPDDIG